MNNNVSLQKKNVGWVIIFHAIGILLIWASPLLIRWWIILIGIGLYFLQLLIWGDCILTRAQFETKNKRGPTFYYYLLTKLGFKPDMQRVRWIADNIMPWVILGLALILQVGFGYKPIF
jgi:hypothetical protein